MTEPAVYDPDPARRVPLLLPPVPEAARHELLQVVELILEHTLEVDPSRYESFFCQVEPIKLTFLLGYLGTPN